MPRPETHADEPRSDRSIGRLLRAKALLPRLAAIGLAVSLVALLTTSAERARMTRGSVESKAAAEAVLERLVAAHPDAVDDPDLLAALGRALYAPYVAGAWAFRAGGELVWAQGSTARSTPVGRAAEELATEEARRLAETLGAEWLSGEQRVALLAASAIAREGEHNDIYRHALRALRDQDGRLTGFVALAYQASPSRGSPSATYVIALTLFLVGLGLYWLALPVWVFLDAGQRGERAFVWAAFTAMGNLVALTAYLLTRRPARPPSVSDGAGV